MNEPVYAVPDCCMNKILLLVAFLLLTATAQSQVLLVGEIFNKDTNEPLPFCAIGIPGHSIGTVANESGVFRITVAQKFADSLIVFSQLGFKPETLTVRQAGGIHQFFLEETPRELRMITITPRAGGKAVVLGNQTTTKTVSAGFASNVLGCMMAVPVLVKGKETLVKNLSVNVVESPFDSLIFRIRVFSMKPDGSPGTDLLDAPVIIRSTTRQGLLTIDLRAYQLVLNQNFFLAVEWIKDFGGTSGLSFSSKLIKGETWYRKSGMDNWQRESRIGVGIFAEAIQW